MHGEEVEAIQKGHYSASKPYQTPRVQSESGWVHKFSLVRKRLDLHGLSGNT